MRLWYQSPAEDWNSALPLGNGKLGAMVFGGPVAERIQLNEDSVWSGGFRDRVNPDCKNNLPEIRRLLREGDIAQAENLATLAMAGTPEFERMYQTLGDIYLTTQRDGGAPGQQPQGRGQLPGAHAPGPLYRRHLPG